jgi:hypothetical protein
VNRTRRVAVTSPQTRLAHAHRRAIGHWRAPRLDAAETSRALSLYHGQRRPAVLTLAALAILLCGLTMVFTLCPGLDQARLLGVLPFPAMVLLAGWQLRRAEALEDER